MRDRWYGDNRDLVKWTVLAHLARVNSAQHILQIAYFRHDDFSAVEIDGERLDIPIAVKTHFRNIRRIEELSLPAKIRVFDPVFRNREEYLDEAKGFISSFSDGKRIVFLDPDTGLEPAKKASLNHALDKDLKCFWCTLKTGDILVLYQHQTNRNGEEWKEPKRSQFEKAIKATSGTAKIAHGTELAHDVILIYAVKA
jgi:hypothetical protein